MTPCLVVCRFTSAVQSWCVKQGQVTPGARRDASTPRGRAVVEKERPSPRPLAISFPRVPCACGGQLCSAQVWKQGVCSVQRCCHVWGHIWIVLPFFPGLNLNLVFIAGCLLAAVAMISAVFVYKAKVSTVRYQPLATDERWINWCKRLFSFLWSCNCSYIYLWAHMKETICKIWSEFLQTFQKRTNRMDSRVGARCLYCLRLSCRVVPGVTVDVNHHSAVF